MRMPRVRFTIGRLMVAVLLVGLASWVVLVAYPQHIAERQALSDYKQAVLLREVAEYAVKEYAEGIYKQDKATYQGQIALAKSDLERANDRLKWSTAMRGKGMVNPATKLADELTKQQAAFDLEQAETQLKVLEQYTKDKQIKSLRSDVEKATADERSKLSLDRQVRSRRWWWAPSSG